MNVVAGRGRGNANTPTTIPAVVGDRTATDPDSPPCEAPPSRSTAEQVDLGIDVITEFGWLALETSQPGLGHVFPSAQLRMVPVLARARNDVQ